MVERNFICNIDGASGKISLVGSAVQDELIGEQAEVATITLSTLSTATTSLIYGQVSSIVLSDGTTYSNEPSKAGTSYVKLNGARRRSLLSVGAPKDWVNSNVKVPAQHMVVVPATIKSPDEERASYEYLAAKKRSRSAKRVLLQDLTCSTNVQGDVNGDCKFDANDYLALMRWIAGTDEYTNLTSTLGDVDSFQRKQVDPTLDWMRGDEFDTSRCAVHGASGSPCPELRDAQFLLKVLEGDYRFLYATSVDDIIVLPESPYDSLTFQAKLYDYASNGVSGEYTRVRFEFTSSNETYFANAAMNFTEATSYISSANGELPVRYAVEAPMSSPGLFSVTASGPSGEFAKENITVALVVETCKSKCASSSVGSTSATIFPYTGVSLDPHMSALGYTYTPVLTFETPDPIAGANEDSYVSALQPQIVSDDYQISGDGFGIGSTTYASLGAFSRIWYLCPWIKHHHKSVSAKLMADRCGNSTPTGFTEASATIAISRRPVSSVKLIILTSTVYPDTAKVQVRFQLMDSTTAGTVLQTGLSLRLSATLTEDASSVASIGCALPSLTTGVGSCELDIPSTWFQADKFVDTKVQLLFRYGIEDSSSSSILTVKLANSATYAALPSTGGVLLEMPKSLASARTNSQFQLLQIRPVSLGAWSGSLKYNTTVLRFSSFTTSTYYNSAALGLENNAESSTEDGIVAIVVTGASSSATLADLTGDEVVLGYITFTINNVPVGTYNDVASFKIDSLVTIGGYTFLESFDAYVTDARGGSVTNAQLIVLDTNEVVGSYSIVSKTEIVNTAVLDITREVQETQIVGYAVYRNPARYIKNGGDEVMQGVECSVTSSAVLFVETGNLDINGVPGTQNACVAKVGKSNEAGAAGASVKLTSGDGLQFVVSYIRVWFPKVVSLEAQDKVLAPVEDVYYEDCSPVYQYTNISALATYGGEWFN